MMSATRNRRFRLPIKMIMDAVDRALEDIGATGIRWSRDGYTATASMPMTFFISYGEDLKVEIFEDGEVEVHSKYAFPLQLFDWMGKNSRNCKQLLDAIADQLEV